MRVNVYAEEMTDRVEIVEKVIDGVTFTGVRFYMYMPVTLKAGTPEQSQITGPFLHRASLKEVKDNVGQYEVDDDSSAVTFWGKKDLRELLVKASLLLDAYYINKGKGDGQFIGMR